MTKLKGRCRSPVRTAVPVYMISKILIDTESLLNPVIGLSAAAVLIKTHGIIPVNKRTSTTQKSGARKLHMNCVF